MQNDKDDLLQCQDSKTSRVGNIKRWGLAGWLWEITNLRATASNSGVMDTWHLAAP